MSRNLEPGATVIPRPERDLTERGDTRRITCDVYSFYSSVKETRFKKNYSGLK